MSFDLAVFSCDSTLSSSAASEIYLQLCEGTDPATMPELIPDSRITAFLTDLAARYPDLDTLPEEQVDSSPWSSAFDHSDSHAIFNIRWSASEEMLQFFLALAPKHQLAVFDPQSDTIHHSGRNPWWKFWSR